MIRISIVLSLFAVVLGQEYEFMNNMVDFEEEPYQSISLPYPYQEDRQNRILNFQSKPNEKTVNFNNRYPYEIVELPAKLKETRKQIKTSLSSIDTSFINILYRGASNFFGLAKSALSLLVVNVPALTLGAVVVVMFCKVTAICTKISAIKSLSEAQKEFGEYVTPERLDIATEFIQEAIRRYRSIQN